MKSLCQGRATVMWGGREVTTAINILSPNKEKARQVQRSPVCTVQTKNVNVIVGRFLPLPLYCQNNGIKCVINMHRLTKHTHRITQNPVHRILMCRWMNNRALGSAISPHAFNSPSPRWRTVKLSHDDVRMSEGKGPRILNLGTR
jgi:hypothetical protein